jgi:hypothetical protein
VHRRLGLGAAAVALTIVCGSCSSAADDRVSGLLDEYEAGWAAGAPLLPASDADQDQCGTLTRAQYDGDPGFGRDSSDQALLFWSGCMDVIVGRDRKTTPEELKVFFED